MEGLELLGKVPDISSIKYFLITLYNIKKRVGKHVPIILSNIQPRFQKKATHSRKLIVNYYNTNQTFPH